jgi:hypothetical protein
MTRVKSGFTSFGEIMPEVTELSPAVQRTMSESVGGVRALIAATQRIIAEEKGNPHKVIQCLGEDFAYIRWQDVGTPIKFLRQMAGNPPIRLGTAGFRHDLVDDENPARHYIAFVVMGYWLPYWLALAVVYLWEIAGFVRYGGVWSKADVDSGLVGVCHGRAARRQGIEVLPELMASEVAAQPIDWSIPSSKL